MTMMGNRYLLEQTKRLIGIEIAFRKVGYLVVRLLLGNMTSCRWFVFVAWSKGRRVEDEWKRTEVDVTLKLQSLCLNQSCFCTIYYLLSTIYTITHTLKKDQKTSRQDGWRYRISRYDLRFCKPLFSLQEIANDRWLGWQLKYLNILLIQVRAFPPYQVDVFCPEITYFRERNYGAQRGE